MFKQVLIGEEKNLFKELVCLMNPLKRFKKQLEELHRQEKIEKTHKRGNFENHNIITHMYKLK